MQLPVKLRDTAPVPMTGEISQEQIAEAFKTLGDFAPAKSWSRHTLLAWIWLKEQPRGATYSLPPAVYEAVKRDVWRVTGPSTFASESVIMFCGQYVVPAAIEERESASMELVPHE